MYPKQIVLDVTQADIDEGVRMESRRCPVWRAADRIFQPLDPYSINVLGAGISVFPGKDVESGVIDYLSTKVMKTWLRRYDHNQPVQPHRFRLRQKKAA